MPTEEPGTVSSELEYRIICASARCSVECFARCKLAQVDDVVAPVALLLKCDRASVASGVLRLVAARSG